MGVLIVETPLGESLHLRKMFTVYVLKSKAHNFHYIGHTQDINTRLKTHNYGKVRSTKGYRPYDIIYTEEYTTKSEAYKREMYLKTGAGNIWLRNMLKDQGLW